MNDVLDMVWDYLQTSLNQFRADVKTAVARTERSEVSGAVDSSTLAAAPLLGTGAGVGSVLFITNARKMGEGPGAGTGTLCYYNPASNTWYRAADDTAAVT